MSKEKISIPQQEEEIQHDIQEGQFQNYHMTDGKGPKEGIKPGRRHEIAMILGAVASLCMFVFSLMLIFRAGSVASNREMALIFLLILSGFVYLISTENKKQTHRQRYVIVGILLILSGFVSWYFYQKADEYFDIVTGILGILLGLTSLANFVRQKVDHYKGGYWNIVIGIIYLVFGSLLIFSPRREELLTVLTGWYLLFFSLDLLWSFLTDLFHLHPKLKERVNISLPIVLAAFLPIGLFQDVNDLVETDPAELKRLEEPDAGKEPDLIVYIHTRAGLLPGFGHCDLLFDGKVYSFGNYDDKSNKLFGFFADGVMGLIPPETHIEFALALSKKILMAYGLTLTQEHKKAVREKLDQIMSKAVYWPTDAELAQEGKLPGTPDSYTDIGSRMYLIEGTHFYKFEPGSNYKTYFGLGMNCVELVNDVVGKSGIDLIKFNGIIAPGTYLAYLDQLYLTGDSIVTDRRLYRMLDGKAQEIPLITDQPINLKELSN